MDPAIPGPTQSVPPKDEDKSSPSTRELMRHTLGHAETAGMSGTPVDLSWAKTGAEGSVPPSAALAQQLPEIIGGYRRVRLLGSGGMAQVYEAVHVHLNRRVALKLLKPGIIDPLFSMRFLRESQAMAQISNPHVIAIYNAGESNGLLYIAMELAPGGDLLQLLRRRGSLDLGHVMELMIGCAKGLEAIHAAGLVHRDIKPTNIFLDRDEQPKIGDLGLARGVVSGAERLTVTGSICGTPSYMSTEQIRGAADIDIRSDIYALGVTMYTLVAGIEPFIGESAHIITLKVMTEAAPDPRTYNRLIPPAIVAIIRKAMDKDRNQRYQSPAEMREELERAVKHQRLLYTAEIASPIPAAVFSAAKVAAQPRDAKDDGLRTAALAAAVMATQPTAPPRPSRAPDAPPSNLHVLKMSAFIVLISVLVYVYWSVKDLKLNNTTVTIPIWASAHGHDEYGTWAELTVLGQTRKMRYCPPSTFLMGSPDNETGHQPWENKHSVTLSNGFWILATECDQSLYATVVGTNPSEYLGVNLPVQNVSWRDAQAFCGELAKRGIPARLPTEAQWEYACRASSLGAFSNEEAIDRQGWMATGAVLEAWRSSGSDPLVAQAAAAHYCAIHTHDPAANPHPGASLIPNHFGLFDMHGNILEWCSDAWDGSSSYAETTLNDPHTTTGSYVIARGGAWFFPSEQCRSAARDGFKSTATLPYIGFRFVILDDQLPLR